MHYLMFVLLSFGTLGLFLPFYIVKAQWKYLKAVNPASMLLRNYVIGCVTAYVLFALAGGPMAALPVFFLAYKFNPLLHDQLRRHGILESPSGLAAWLFGPFYTQYVLNKITVAELVNQQTQAQLAAPAVEMGPVDKNPALGSY